ncbi:hypothetical protein [Thermogutta sp.]|uniref:hypothetical protein n=1 Tax=Thermogutta sp. TaxID=1962930 RepID=UPI00321FCAC6
MIRDRRQSVTENDSLCPMRELPRRGALSGIGEQRRSSKLSRLIAATPSAFLLGLVIMAGCTLIPRPAVQPMIHNPFPQIHKVAVAPFFNLSTEPTLDGRQVAIAYYNELQEIPGFEVIPVGVVERAMTIHRISLNSAADARRLAQVLGADAVVVGAVTEYSPYYPPRCGLQVEWYAANPGFHPVPPGYGLPWGTDDERHIPRRLLLEAQIAYARGALAEATPQCDAATTTAWSSSGEKAPATSDSAVSKSASGAAENEISPEKLVPQATPANPPCIPTNEPFLVHTRVYNGGDERFTRLLREYARFRNDAQLSGWQPYLAKSEEFLRFCCRLHIWEMLTARGGADEMEVTWRPPDVR